MALHVTTAHGRDQHLGFIGSIVTSGATVYAVGGTYHQATILHSVDGGRSFAQVHAPRTAGLRDVHL